MSHKTRGMQDWPNLEKRNMEYGNLSSAARGNVSPPTILALARELGGERLATTCLLRGTPGTERQPIEPVTILERGAGGKNIFGIENLYTYLKIDPKEHPAPQGLGPNEIVTPFGPVQREYPPIEGDERLRMCLKEYLTKLHELPNDFDIAVSAGGRPMLDDIVRSFSNDTLYIIPEIMYSALVGQIKDHGRKMETVSVNLDDFSASEYLENILKKVAELQKNGARNMVFIDTIPGNPLGIVYPEDKRKEFLNRLQAAGVTVVIDGFYSTYADPDSSNFPNSPFRGLDDMNNRIWIGGATKDGPRPMPGLRVAWAVGDKRIIQGIQNVQSMVGGGVSNLDQDFAFRNIFLIYPEALRAFASEIHQRRSRARKILADMGFYILGEQDNPDALNHAGMYLLGKVPKDTPDLVTGFHRWAEAGIPPGLPLETFQANVNGTQLFQALRGGEIGDQTFPTARYARICIGAEDEKVLQALEAVRVRINDI